MIKKNKSNNAFHTPHTFPIYILMNNMIFYLTCLLRKPNMFSDTSTAPIKGLNKVAYMMLILLSFFAQAGNLFAQAPSTGENFIRKEAVRIPGITTDAAVLGLNSDQKLTSYQYMDGIGRSLQLVGVQASPTKKDIVQANYYDTKGRPLRGYLPYRATTSNGTFRSASLSEQATFYSTPPAGIPAESAAYNTAVFEDSPLNRALAATKVGNEFHTKQSTARLKVNDASVIRRWSIVSGLPKSTTTYPASSLTMQEAKDESNVISRSYTDFAGRTVLTQVQANTSAWLNTYYVYNDYDELLFIIPAAAAANLSPDLAYADLWFTQYEYDNLGRRTGAKAPGAGWNYIIYDRWDRPVLSQDAVQRAKATPEWTFAKYDSHNRLVITGTLATTATRASLTSAVEASATRDELRTTANTLGYTLNRTYPTTATEATVISITYHDDYAFLGISGWSSNNSLYNYIAESGFSGIRSSLVKGLVTGSKSRTQGTNTIWLHSVIYYDKFYQPLQTIAGHQQGGTLKTITQYAFSGEVQKSLNIYSHSGGTTRVQRRYTYDHAGRSLKTYHKLNALSEVMLSDITYNELGQVHRSKHHSRNNGSSWLYQTVSDYAIQGWIKKMQYQFSNGTNVFTQELAYQNALGTGNTARFDGMITANSWKHSGTAPQRAYNYTYDMPKRLTQSVYAQKNSTSTSWTANNFYNESGITYDANGNLTTMVRNQESTTATAVQIDNLSYTYSGNRLSTVTDNAPTATKATGFQDGNISGADYTYNANGNVIADKNKGITSITYNKLDLPERINFASGANIRYTYSASKALLTVSYHSTSTGTATKTLQYIGELVFENSVLSDINHEFGRVLATASNKYQYYLSDYLGSTRVVLQEDPASFTTTATFETAAVEEESAQFLEYDNTTRVAASVFDHTNKNDSKYALRLGGGPNESMGPAKSISVMPGDTVRMAVYGKYIGAKEAKNNPALLALALQMTNPAIALEGAIGPVTQQSQQSFAALLAGKSKDKNAPPAFLNYLFFDREMNYKTGGFVQMTEAAREDGSDVPHEELSQEIVMEEAGYLYVYLSNEGAPQEGEAYFDDFTIQTSESYIVQSVDYYPYGLAARNWIRQGEKATKDLFQGKTYEELTKLSDFHARQYDAALGRWLGVDPQNQFSSPYTGMGNNPVMMADPDGELAWFVPIIIGAVIGGTVGGIHAANDPNMSIGKGILLGATIGGLSGGAAAGVSAIGGGAMLAGAAGGAVGGAGFSGMATGWDAQAMLKGGAIGAASGFIGGGFASAIGGGGGAFVGGAAADITGQLLSTGDVNLGKSLIAGGISFGMYHATSYYGWKFDGGNNLGGHDISYRQYLSMQADFQRSRFWRNERGGFLLDNGKIWRFPASSRTSHGINWQGDIPEGAFAMYHTHWDAPGKTIWVNSMGDRVDNSSNPLALLAPGVGQTTTARYHGAYDYMPWDSYVINRFDMSFNPGGTSTLNTFSDPFLRFFYIFNFRR